VTTVGIEIDIVTWKVFCRISTLVADRGSMLICEGRVASVERVDTRTWMGLERGFPFSRDCIASMEAERESTLLGCLETSSLQTAIAVLSSPLSS
jgi:hypothetical protein